MTVNCQPPTGRRTVVRVHRSTPCHAATHLTLQYVTTTIQPVSILTGSEVAMAHRRRILAVHVAVVAIAVATLTGTFAGSAAAAPMFQRYVALGDSYASGPLIPRQTGLPVGCGRSDHHYPSDLAEALAI